MYRQFYRFNERPFAITPNSRFFYSSSSHQGALASLHYGVAERKGFILLTGEVGVGKTTTIRSFLNELGPETETALVLNPLISERDILFTITHDLAVPGEQGDSIRTEIDRLNRYLLDRYARNQNTLVVIDEAQNLSFEAMEMVRLLSNLETENDKLLQIILVGQPELEQKLAEDSLRQLRQRIQVHCRIEPFDEDQTRDYINHCIERAGSPYPVVEFTRAAVRKIHRISGGLPRIINKVGDYALMAGFVQEARSITDEIVEMGLADIATLIGEKPMNRRWRLWPFATRKKTCH